MNRIHYQIDSYRYQALELQIMGKFKIKLLEFFGKFKKIAQGSPKQKVTLKFEGDTGKTDFALSFLAWISVAVVWLFFITLGLGFILLLSVGLGFCVY